MGNSQDDINLVDNCIIKLESLSQLGCEDSLQAEYLYLTPLENDAGSSYAISKIVSQSVHASKTIVEGQRTDLGKTPASTGSKAQLKSKSQLIGKIIGHYFIERSIGRGGMGEVYLARDVNLGRPVALKLLRSDIKRNEDRVRQFQQEARAVSALNHPNIVTLYEVGEIGGSPYIVSEFIEGLTLREVINNFSPQRGMKLDQTLEITVQIGNALAAAHRAGIIHRDIKPENVMMRQDGYVKVLDFGLAKLTEEKIGEWESGKGGETTDILFIPRSPALPLSRSAEILQGTLSYISPEQARGFKIDCRTDIFSLGILLYEIVTGKIPFDGATTNDVITAILSREAPPISDCVPDAPAELQRIISKALCKNRDERYGSINELLAELRDLKEELKLHSRQERKTLSASGRLSGELEYGIIPIKQEDERTQSVKINDDVIARQPVTNFSADNSQEITPAEGLVKVKGAASNHNNLIGGIRRRIRLIALTLICSLVLLTGALLAYAWWIKRHP